MKEMIFSLPDGRKLLIRSEALKKMEKYRQFNPKDTEAGGILIGRILFDSNDFIIDIVSEPMFSDIRKRSYFKRKPEAHQAYFDAEWTASDGRCFYLGEWHTHPERIPHPSKVDKTDWKRIMNLSFESDYLFFVIVGTQETKAWCADRDKERIFELRGETNDEQAK